MVDAVVESQNGGNVAGAGGMIRSGSRCCRRGSSISWDGAANDRE